VSWPPSLIPVAYDASTAGLPGLRVIGAICGNGCTSRGAT